MLISSSFYANISLAWVTALSKPDLIISVSGFTSFGSLAKVHLIVRFVAPGIARPSEEERFGLKPCPWPFDWSVGCLEKICVTWARRSPPYNDLRSACLGFGSLLFVLPAVLVLWDHLKFSFSCHFGGRTSSCSRLVAIRRKLHLIGCGSIFCQNFSGLRSSLIVNNFLRSPTWRVWLRLCTVNKRNEWRGRERDLRALCLSLHHDRLWFFRRRSIKLHSLRVRPLLTFVIAYQKGLSMTLFLTVYPSRSETPCSARFRLSTNLWFPSGVLGRSILRDGNM